MALDIDNLREYLTIEDKSIKNISYEFHEQSPLKNYPLLIYGDRYYCYSRILLFHAIESFIYDKLRTANPQAFMNRFGQIFETYVEKSLTYGKLNFIKEEDLKNIYITIINL